MGGILATMVVASDDREALVPNIDAVGTRVSVLACVALERPLLILTASTAPSISVYSGQIGCEQS